MRVIVLGAAGRLGSHVLAAAVQAGHEATAFVRSKERLAAAVGQELVDRVTVREGDVLHGAELAEAMRGQEAAVQAAGYIGDSPQEGRQLQLLVESATRAANTSLVGARRLWVLGGAGALDLPSRRLMLVDVPGFPFPKYRVHKANCAFLCCPEFASLDWSLACPGVMTQGPPAGTATQAAAVGDWRVVAGRETAPQAARVSVDCLPVQLPSWAALLPPTLLLPAVAAIKGQLVGPSYAEVAAAIVQHLEPGGLLRHRRVGFAAAPAQGS